VSTLIDPVNELSRVVGRFRRQLRRTAERGFDSERLTESQSELLWLVSRRPGISVSAAAAELGLVANTASTLVSKLVAKGYLVRTADESDRRVGQLSLAGAAQQVVDTTHAARRELLTDVLNELGDDQIEALTKGLAVLETMTRRLQER